MEREEYKADFFFKSKKAHFGALIESIVWRPLDLSVHITPQY